MFIASCTMSIGQFPFIKSGGEMESAKATGIYHPLRPLTSTVPTLPTPTAQLPTPAYTSNSGSNSSISFAISICSCVLLVWLPNPLARRVHKQPQTTIGISSWMRFPIFAFRIFVFSLCVHFPLPIDTQANLQCPVPFKSIKARGIIAYRSVYC